MGEKKKKNINTKKKKLIGGNKNIVILEFSGSGIKLSKYDYKYELLVKDGKKEENIYFYDFNKDNYLKSEDKCMEYYNSNIEGNELYIFISGGHVEKCKKSDTKGTAAAAAAAVTADATAADATTAAKLKTFKYNSKILQEFLARKKFLFDNKNPNYFGPEKEAYLEANAFIQYLKLLDKKGLLDTLLLAETNQTNQTKLTKLEDLYPILLINAGSTTIQFVRIEIDRTLDFEKYKTFRLNNNPSIPYTELNEHLETLQIFMGQETKNVFFTSNYGYMMCDAPYFLPKKIEYEKESESELFVKKKKNETYIDTLHEDFINCAETEPKCERQKPPPVCCKTTIAEPYWGGFKSLNEKIFSKPDDFFLYSHTEMPSFYVFKFLEKPELKASNKKEKKTETIELNAVEGIIQHIKGKTIIPSVSNRKAMFQGGGIKKTKRNKKRKLFNTKRNKKRKLFNTKRNKKHKSK